MSESRVIARNPVDLLSHEHLLLESLLDAYQELDSRQVQQKKELFRRIEHEVSDHIRTEELLLYPTLMKLEDALARELVARALEAHRRIECVLADLRGPGSEPTLDGRGMALLRNYTRWHMEFERKEIYPLASRLPHVTLNQLGLELEMRLFKEGTAQGDDGLETS